MGKSKLSPPSGSAALRQLDSIYKKALLYIFIERERAFEAPQRKVKIKI